ncbi:MAG: hypothetical protein M3281_04140 [Chloroflexota bacterium]|nr:hypothetical protein [Chloroflexota bacterium]
MSEEAVRAVVQLALDDERFAALLSERPYDALEGYELDPSEQGALVAASDQDLTKLGVDADVAHRFTALFRISRGGGG